MGDRSGGVPSQGFDPQIPDDFDDDYGSILLTLSFFASKELAEGIALNPATGT